MQNENTWNMLKILNFLHKIEKLKTTYRYNKTAPWRNESSADHSWRLALMVFIIADELKLDIDVNKAVKIALVHDLAEAITWDIDAVLIAEWKVTKEYKEEEEKKAMEILRKMLPVSIGEDLFELWNEYEDNNTKEAMFVKALDKLENLCQLIEFWYKMYDKPEFIANYADKHVKKFPELTEMLMLIKAELKQEFQKWDIEWKEEYDRM